MNGLGGELLVVEGGERVEKTADSSQFPWQLKAFPTHSLSLCLILPHFFHTSFSFQCFSRCWGAVSIMACSSLFPPFHFLFSLLLLAGYRAPEIPLPHLSQVRCSFCVFASCVLSLFPMGAPQSPLYLNQVGFKLDVFF